jgi:hypothetical protein
MILKGPQVVVWGDVLGSAALQSFDHRPGHPEVFAGHFPQQALVEALGAPFEAAVHRALLRVQEQLDHDVVMPWLSS